MRLSKQHEESFEQAYGELAEELHIFFLELNRVGFTPDQAIDLIIAILCKPDRLSDYKKEKIHNWDLIKKKIAETKKPDFTNHTGDDYPN